jgi:hypothetical protein
VSLTDRLNLGAVREPQLQAYGRLYEGMQTQALTLSYIDAFWILGVAAVIMFFLSFLLRKNNPRGQRASAVAH